MLGRDFASALSEPKMNEHAPQLDASAEIAAPHLPHRNVPDALDAI
jgi:hypothetical protein